MSTAHVTGLHQVRGRVRDPSRFKSKLCLVAVFVENGRKSKDIKVEEGYVVMLEPRIMPKFFLLGDCATHWGEKCKIPAGWV